MPETVEAKQGIRKERIGIVLSNKMQKTIVVQVQSATRHPRVGKILQQFKKFKVHDEKNTAQIGDKVRIRETRPLSKDKRWRLVEVLGHGHLRVKTEIDDPTKPAPAKGGSASISGGEVKS